MASFNRLCITKCFVFTFIVVTISSEKVNNNSIQVGEVSSTENSNSVEGITGPTPEVDEELQERYQKWSDSFWKNNGSQQDVLQFQSDLMKSYMDTTVSPCDDFHQYACGNWGRLNPFPKSSIRNTVFHVLRDYTFLASKEILEEKPVGGSDQQSSSNDDAEVKARKLYASCMNIELRKSRGVQPLLNVLQELGGWPPIEENWSGDNFNWLEVMTKARQMAKTIFISSEIDPKLINSNEYVTYIGPAQTRSKNSLLDNPKRTKNLQTYAEVIIRLFGIDRERAHRDAKEIIDFSVRLHGISSNLTEIQDAFAAHQVMTVDELISEVPDIDWKYFLSKIQNRQISGDLELSVLFLDYLKELSSLLRSSESRTIANYMLWKIVQPSIAFLDERFEEAEKKFSEIETGTSKEKAPRWMRCINIVNSCIGFAVGATFVRQHFNESSKNEVINLTQSLKDQFMQVLLHNDWLDEPTRSEAIRKLEKLGIQVGYPDFIIKSDELNRWYENYTINSDTYFENILSSKRAEVIREINLIDKIVDKKRWQTHPHVVNAYFKQNTNDIFFPAGILMPPFFHKDFPEALKFGGIGTFLSHEMTHGFDSAGREFDLNGNVRNWWTNESSYAFNERVECVISQYNNYTFHNKSLDGNRSKGENIADNGALGLAYNAYEKWLNSHPNKIDDEALPGLNLTARQLFFLGNAQLWCGAIRPDSIEYQLRVDKHTPEKYRLIGTVSNFKQFSEEFHCPIGSNMNPVNKCKVW